MAWRRTGDKPLPEPMLDPAPRRIYVALVEDELTEIWIKCWIHHPRKCMWNVVCKMVAILFKPQCVNTTSQNTTPHQLQCSFPLVAHCLNTPWFMDTAQVTSVLDSFTVSLHSPNGRLAVRVVYEDCQWPLKTSGNSHRSREPTLHCGQTILTNVYTTKS